MILNNKKNMNSIISIQDDNINISNKSKELYEKVVKILAIARTNISLGIWDRENFYKFFRQLTKMDITTFEDVYDEMLLLLNIPLSEVEKRLSYLDEKLNLRLFEAERKMSNVKEKNQKTGDITTIQKLVFVPHKFSAADIVLFFQRLTSEVNKSCCAILRSYQSKIDVFETLEEKELALQLFIDSLNEKDEFMCNIILKPYSEWISALPKDDSIYNYLISKKPYLISKNINNLKTKLSYYKQHEASEKYIAERCSNRINEMTVERKKFNNCRRHSINF